MEEVSEGGRREKEGWREGGRGFSLVTLLCTRVPSQVFIPIPYCISSVPIGIVGTGPVPPCLVPERAATGGAGGGGPRTDARC